jgi:hypothetical protein
MTFPPRYLHFRLKALQCYHDNPTVVRSKHTATIVRDDKPMGKSFHISV